MLVNQRQDSFDFSQNRSETPNNFIPYNMNNSRGDRLPFTLSQAQAIQHHLISAKQWRDLALFMTGVDTHLRASDLLRLCVSDITDNHGHVREKLIGRQQKNKSTYEGYLSSPTREAVAHWIALSNKSGKDYLFTRLKPVIGESNHPISREAFASRIKYWASSIGLDPVNYSTKTLRKSRVRHILEKANYDYQVPRLLLGHSDIRSTVHYCAIAEETALQISSEVQFFDPNTFPNQEEG